MNMEQTNSILVLLVLTLAARLLQTLNLILPFWMLIQFVISQYIQCYCLHGDDCIRDICPDGYNFYHEPRLHSTGGGVVLKDFLNVETIPCGHYGSFNFESIKLTLMIYNYNHHHHHHHHQINNTIFFCLPNLSVSPSWSQYRVSSDFSHYLNYITTMPGYLILVGDFNLHVALNDGSVILPFKYARNIGVTSDSVPNFEHRITDICNSTIVFHCCMVFLGAFYISYSLYRLRSSLDFRWLQVWPYHAITQEALPAACWRSYYF